MRLNICTLSSRPQFLRQIYNSIPHETDIIWHIAKSSRTPPLEDLQDERVKVYELDCEDTDTPFKMNSIFEKIVEQGTDSYFCILDDDTIFHEGMYKLYNLYKNKAFMIIGRQVDKDMITRLYGTLPYECAIDSGNVLCHSSVLTVEKWGEKHWDEVYHADFDFWNRCFKHFGITRTDIVEDAISIYNLYSEKPDSLQYIRG